MKTKETHPVDSKFIKRGKRQIVLEVRFNTDSMVPDKPLGTIVPKNMWDNGMVRVRANPEHGLKSQTPIHFNSFAEILLAIETTIRDSGLTLHTSSRSRKYVRQSKSYPPRKARSANPP
jgi:hypothetical protein